MKPELCPLVTVNTCSEVFLPAFTQNLLPSVEKQDVQDPYKYPFFFLLFHYVERKGRSFEIFNTLFNSNLVIEKF